MEALRVIPENSPHKQVLIACIAVVGLSVLPLPYAYYFFLRIVIFGSLLWLALRELGKDSGFWKTVLGALTILGLILYNPLLPVHLGSKFIWFCLNLAGLFLIRKLMTRDLLDLEQVTIKNPKRD